MGSEDHADPDSAGQLHHVELSVPADVLDEVLAWWAWLLDELGSEAGGYYAGYVEGPAGLTVEVVAPE
jgi:hypothetical protein